MADLLPHPTGSDKSSWRDHLKIHPAAELFPRMSEDELRTLAADIKRNGLQTPITVMVDRAGNNGEWCYQLLDGRNRLDANRHRQRRTRRVKNHHR
jgi:hypothetical protein